MLHAYDNDTRPPTDLLTEARRMAASPPCAHHNTEERRPISRFCLDCGEKMPMDSDG